MCADGQFEPTGDIIGDILRRYEQLSSDVNAAAVASRIAREARQAYGTERLYIRSDINRQKREVLERVVVGESISAQSNRLGLARSTVWRRLKYLKEKKD